MTPKVGERKVVYCPMTSSMVLAEYEGYSSEEYDGWLHLHNDTLAEDLYEAEEFLVREVAEEAVIR